MEITEISGSAFAVGQQLGERGRAAWQHKLTATRLWQSVMTMLSSAQLAEMRAAVIADYPQIWQELQGMAHGLNVSVDEVFAWNCRGDLLRSTSDGCSTVAGFTAGGDWVIAHNEDGLPQLREDCALVRVRPGRGLGFTGFVYPGSLPGHTFSINERGIVNTVNNIRALHRPSGLPRQVLARAALNASTLDEAVQWLTAPPRAGAFHHTLSQAGDRRIFSVEASGSGCSVVQVADVMSHANHLIHPAMAGVQQIVTASSAARQATLAGQLCRQQTLEANAAKTLLSDCSNAQLPVYRLSPTDPDEENTLATALFILNEGGVSWQISGLDRQSPQVQGSFRYGAP